MRNVSDNFIFSKGADLKKDAVILFEFEDSIIDLTHPVETWQLGGGSNFIYETGKVGRCINSISGTTNAIRNDIILDQVIRTSFSSGGVDVPFSVSFWINASSVGATYGAIFGKNGIGSSIASTTAEYNFHLTPQRRLVYTKYSELSNVNYTTYTSVAQLTFGNWYHVVLVDDALGNVKLYIDTVDSSLTVANVGTGFVKFGASIDNRFGLFTTPTTTALARTLYGKLDQFLIRRSTLTPNQINRIYNGGFGRVIL